MCLQHDLCIPDISRQPLHLDNIIFITPVATVQIRVASQIIKVNNGIKPVLHSRWDGELVCDILQILSCRDYAFFRAAHNPHLGLCLGCVGDADLNFELFLYCLNIGSALPNNHANKSSVGVELLDAGILVLGTTCLNDFQALIPAVIKLLHLELMAQMQLQQQLGPLVFHGASDEKDFNSSATNNNYFCQQYARLCLYLREASPDIIGLGPLRQAGLHVHPCRRQHALGQRRLRAHRSDVVLLKNARLRLTGKLDINKG
mmetsp:Transcript_8205/g.17406  ORF Transcript_8205/g.17406 Transcript_8205/m.17406 type:complete len:260 (-) Transcript_8205:12-791(-)